MTAGRHADSWLWDYIAPKVGVINIHEVINIHGNMPPSIRGFSTVQCKKPIINNTTRQK